MPHNPGLTGETPLAFSSNERGNRMRSAGGISQSAVSISTSQLIAASFIASLNSSGIHEPSCSTTNPATSARSEAGSSLNFAMTCCARIPNNSRSVSRDARRNSAARRVGRRSTSESCEGVNQFSDGLRNVGRRQTQLARRTLWIERGRSRRSIRCLHGDDERLTHPEPPGQCKREVRVGNLPAS